jgi:hypothetical protein
MSRPKCSICRGAGCHVCFDKGYIEEWPTERLEREKQQMVEALEAAFAFMESVTEFNEQTGGTTPPDALELYEQLKSALALIRQR